MRFLNSFVAIAALAAAPFASAQSLAVKEFIAYGQSHPVRHASLAARQSLANLPTCAQPAIEKGITSTPCPLTDYSCICHSEGFIDGVDTSIKASCSADDQKATLAFADQVCASAGAPLKNDAAAAPAASAPAASAPAESAPATSAADAAAPEATDSSTPMSSAAPATVSSTNSLTVTSSPSGRLAIRVLSTLSPSISSTTALAASPSHGLSSTSTSASTSSGIPFPTSSASGPASFPKPTCTTASTKTVHYTTRLTTISTTSTVTIPLLTPHSQVPTVTPPYPAGNASGSANCTNSTTPFLGAANELHISSIPSLVSLAFFALFGVMFL